MRIRFKDLNEKWQEGEVLEDKNGWLLVRPTTPRPEIKTPTMTLQPIGCVRINKEFTNNWSEIKGDHK